MASIRLQIRSSGKVFPLSFSPEDTFANLLQSISKNLDNTPVDCLQLKTGFPPKPLVADLSKKLSDIVRSGDAVICDVRAAPIPAAFPMVHTEETSGGSLNEHAPGTAQVVQESFRMDFGGEEDHFVLREVPDDNSCLFNSVKYVVEHDTSFKHAPALRRVVADEILRNRDEYSEAVLGMAPDKYASFILNTMRWGGAIELAILSNHFKIELCVFDVESMHMHRFGQDQSYSQRGYLCYTGIHYDALVRLPFQGAPAELEGTLFPTDDPLPETQVRSVVQQLHDAGKYTNMHKCSLVCGDCGSKIVGEKEALEHAKRTGHGNFQEVQS
eukprot:Rmarinus@m.18940